MNIKLFREVHLSNLENIDGRQADGIYYGILPRIFFSRAFERSFGRNYCFSISAFTSLVVKLETQKRFKLRHNEIMKAPMELIENKIIKFNSTRSTLQASFKPTSRYIFLSFMLQIAILLNASISFLPSRLRLISPIKQRLSPLSSRTFPNMSTKRD